jgi:hypothetical protein
VAGKQLIVKGLNKEKYKIASCTGYNKDISKNFIWQAIVRGHSVSTEGPFFLQSTVEYR